MKIKTFYLTLIFCIALFFPILSAKAQNVSTDNNRNPQETAFAEASGLNSGASATKTIATIISILLGFLGLLFVILMIYAGFIWMTAQGDEGKVSQARGIIITAIIGLAVIASAYIITHFVFESLKNATYS